MNVGGDVQRIEITERESPVFGGAEFAGVGNYERLHGTVFGELDPTHRLNASIVNLDRAVRNPRGHVEYHSDFRILKPLDLDRGNGCLVYDVPNRGNQPIMARLNGAPDGGHPQHAGNGFLMRRGFAVVWSGWQGDVPPGADRLTTHFPPSRHQRHGARGVHRRGHRIARRQQHPRAVRGAVCWHAGLSGRRPCRCDADGGEREADPRATPPGLAWRLIDDRHVEITRPTAPGFDRGAIYEFVYRVRDPIVMGIGFAAIRDIVSFLRYGTKDNPLAPQERLCIRRALGFGISQSGRVLRDLVYLGFNEDFAGRPVFDGILPVVAGSRRTCINWQFAQAGRYSRQHEDHSYGDDQFPFSYPTLSDPVSGRSGGILQRAHDAGVCPKVLHLDTESDLSQARSSLVATDTSGADLAMPDEVRIYTISGVSHAPFRPLSKPVMQLPGNRLGYGAFMRALLVALFEWVEYGVAPPNSQFPSRADATLVSLAEVRATFPKLPQVNFPNVLNELRLRDHSVEPPIESIAYPVFVQATDADGNALGGIRHPMVDAPLATHTGWSLRASGYGEGDLFTIQGSMIPFATTEAERQRAGDPRPSVEARYASRDVWAARLAAATDRLVAERLLLLEDGDRLLAAARASWDVYQAL